MSAFCQVDIGLVPLKRVLRSLLHQLTIHMLGSQSCEVRFGIRMRSKFMGDVNYFKTRFLDKVEMLARNIQDRR